MNFKHTTTTFLSKLGKHNIHSLGKDMGFDEFIKHSMNLKEGKMNPETFSKISQGMINTDTLVNLGIRAGSGIVTKLIENGFNSFTNKESQKIPFASSNQRTQLGTKTATYQSTHTHIGIPTTQRLKRIIHTPTMDYDEKLISSSERDYQNHEKRKNLMLRSGFNEKGYTFFMEDTYFTVENYLQFYNQGNKISNILSNSRTKTDLYGCVYKTKNKFKFMNKMDFYDLNLRLHLVKLTDQSKDVRELIQDLTNNKSSVVDKHSVFL